MHNTTPMANHVLACAGAVVAVLLFACDVSVSQANKTLPTPQWHVGDWWEVERRAVPVQIAMSMERLGWYGPFRYRYEVVGIEEVEGYQCYKLKQTVIGKDGRLYESGDYLYLNVADLSVVKTLVDVKKRDGTLHREERLQTPGYHAALAYIAIRWWCAFPLVAGERKGVGSDALEPCFRRADGSIKTLTGTEPMPDVFEYRSTLQQVTVENLEIGSKRVEVFRVRFLKADQNGQLRDYASMRWIAGVGFPIHIWMNEPYPMHVRLVASSHKLPFEIPRLRVEGLKVLDEIER